MPLSLLVLLVPINPHDGTMTTPVACSAWLGFLSGLELTWLLAYRAGLGDSVLFHTALVLQQALLFSQSVSPVQLFETPWTAARQASLSFTTSQRLLRLMSIESVMPSNHLILCRPLLLLPSIFPSIRVFPMSPLFRLAQTYSHGS